MMGGERERSDADFASLLVRIHSREERLNAQDLAHYIFYNLTDGGNKRVKDNFDRGTK